jgi:hypothetical protein
MTLSLRTKQWFIIALLSMLTALSAAAFLIVEVRGQGAVLSATLAAASEQEARANAQTQVERLITETTEARETLGNNFLTQTADTIEILTMLEALSPTLGVSISKQTIEELEDKNAVGRTEMRLRFTYSGEKYRVLEFTRYLESLPYHSRLTAISLSGDDTLWSGDAEVLLTVINP